MALRNFVPAHLSSLRRLAARWKAARRGNIAMMTSLLMAPIVGMMGLALDYGHLILVKSRLDQAALAAASAAANAARNVVQTSEGRSDTAYNQAEFNTKAIDDGKTIGANIFKAQFGSTGPTLTTGPTATVTVERISNTFTGKVEYNAGIETYFAKYFNVRVFNIKGRQSMIVGMTDTQTQGSTPGSIIDEKWIAPVSEVKVGDASKPVINDWYSGTPGNTRKPVSQNDGPTINGDSSSKTRIGSSDGKVPRVLSKKVFLLDGDYELRYWYRSTIAYPDYDPVFICGSVEGEMHWVTSSTTHALTASPNSASVNGSFRLAQSSRAGVYLDPIMSNPQLATTPPPETYFPRPPNLPYNASSSPPNLRAENSKNRIDICAYSKEWIERSVKVKITSPGYFWLSFVAEPPQSTNTINGFDLGRVQFCANTCRETLQTNWPWAANTVLYKDSFEARPPTVKSDGDEFDPSFSGFTTAARYSRPPNWDAGRYGGVAAGLWKRASFAYEVDPSVSDDTKTRLVSQRLGVWLYRRMVLMPGVYRVKFKAGAVRPLPTGNWCIERTGVSASGAPIQGWVFHDPIPSSCVCPVGAYTAVVMSDEGAYTQANVSTNNTAPNTTPNKYRNTDDPSGSALSDCVSRTSTATERYCFLVARTQYYGFQLRVQGPYDVSQAGQPTTNPRLGTSGVFLDDLEVELLSPGVKNKFKATPDDPGPGDFENFATECKSGMASIANEASYRNVISGGVPVWPGLQVPAAAYTTPPLRVVVTAPSQ